MSRECRSDLTWRDSESCNQGIIFPTLIRILHDFLTLLFYLLNVIGNFGWIKNDGGPSRSEK